MLRAPNDEMLMVYLILSPGSARPLPLLSKIRASLLVAAKPSPINTSSKANPSSRTLGSLPKANLKSTDGLPPSPASKLLAGTQPSLPGILPSREVPLQPISCPPGSPTRPELLNQLPESPTVPTRCQVAPPSMEDCSTAPSQSVSEFHQALNPTTGNLRLEKSKHGPTTAEASLLRYNSWPRPPVTQAFTPLAAP